MDVETVEVDLSDKQEVGISRNETLVSSGELKKNSFNSFLENENFNFEKESIKLEVSKEVGILNLNSSANENKLFKIDELKEEIEELGGELNVESIKKELKKDIVSKREVVKESGDVKLNDITPLEMKNINFEKKDVSGVEFKTGKKQGLLNEVVKEEIEESGEIKESDTIVDNERVNLFKRSVEKLGIKKYGFKDIKVNSSSETEVFVSTTVSDIEATEKSEKVNSVVRNFTDYSSVIEQVNKGVKLNFNGDVKELKIKLTPEELGDVEVKIRMENGVIKTDFIVENEKVKEILESRFNELKSTLLEEGVETSELNVFISNGERREREEQDQNSQLSLGKKRIKALEDKKTADTKVIERGAAYSYSGGAGLNIVV